VDEINRTTPRTQSALLEAMNEAQVSTDGKTYTLGPPFMVIATQNPYEFEGTYFLPENQLDRFMLRLRVGYPQPQVEREILRSRPGQTRLTNLQPVITVSQIVALQERVERVRVDEAILDYVLAIAEATRRSEELMIGMSTRASLAMVQAAKAQAILEERDYVVPDDVKGLATSVCAHRLITKALSRDGQSSASEAIFERILETVPVPQ
jgi:MoxR-like ATPase